MESDLRASIEAQILKKKPPKLKNVDRTISLAIDNYSPGTSGIVMDPSMMLEEELLPTMVPPPLSVPAQDAKKSTIFYVGGGAAGVAATNYPDYHTHHVPHVGHSATTTRKQNMRRSDTLDVYTAEMYEMRKTNSFNANEGGSIEEAIIASRRTGSMRNTGAGYQHEFDTIEQKPVSPRQAHASEVPHSTQQNRRNCRMHKSLYDPHRARHEHTKKEQSIDSMKCHSVGDDDEGAIGGAKRKLSPKFNSAGASLENDVFHIRSNSSRSTDEMEAIAPGDVIEVSTMQKKVAMQTAAIIAAAPSGPHIQQAHKHSSHSLDKAHSFRRIARATQSFYLNPNAYDELRLQRGGVAMPGGSGVAGKKIHSASMRAKPFREALSEAKKSKSFVADPFLEYELSPHRRDSKFVTGDVEIKKSPRLGAGDGIAAAAAIAIARASYEHRKASDFDPTGLDYDAIMRAYRQTRRKSSVTSAGKKKAAKKSSIDADTEDDVEDSESSRKRKKIVCIIITVFLSLVFASVFVVVFTLTHSTVSQGQNHTKKSYTFSRDMPLHSLHYNNGKTDLNYSTQFRYNIIYLWLMLVRFIGH